MNRTHKVRNLFELVNNGLKNKQFLNKKQFINNPQQEKYYSRLSKYLNNPQVKFYSRLSWELNPRHTSRKEISSSEFNFIISVIKNIDKLDGNPTSQEIRNLNDQLTQIKIMLKKHVSRKTNNAISKLHGLFNKVKKYGSKYFTR